MMIKTIKTTVNILVMVSVWCVGVMLVVSLAILARYLIVGSLTAYHLMHS